MKTILPAALAGVAIVCPAWAEEPLELRTGNVVVTATRFEEEPTNLPIGVDVITRDEILKSGASTLPQLLSRQTGIRTRDASGSPNQQIDMRGFGVTGDQNTLILVDGQRISERELVSPNLTSIPLDSIERIEIVRGGGAVLYGAGATGGTINIITRGSKPSSSGGNVRAGYGTYDTWEASAGLTAANEAVGLAMNAARFQSDNYRVNNEITQRNLQADLRWFAPQGPVYLKFGISDEDLRLPGARTEAQLTSDRRGTATPDDFGTLQNARWVVGTQQSLEFGDLGFDASYRTRDSVSVVQPGRTDIEGQVAALAPRLRVPFTWLVRHTLVAGLDWEQWDYSTSAVFPPFLPSVADSEQSNRAVYVRDTLELGAGRLFSLGGRLQRTETTITESGSPPASQVRRPAAWDMALRQNLSASSYLYGRAGYSFRFANVDENRFRATLLEPQTAHDAEIGGEVRNGPMRGRAAIYRINLNNEILFLPSDVAPPFGANVNLPPTQRKGFELELGYEVGTWLSLSADYVYMVAKFKQGDFGGVDVSGKNIPLVPRHQGGLKATVTPRQHLQVTGVVSYVGEQYYDNDQSNSFGRKMPAYTVVDLAATLDRGAWSWSASARNILNEAYYSYGIRSIAAPTFNAYPAPERGFFLTAQYRLGSH